MMQSHSATVQVNGMTLAYTEWPGERGPLICLPHLTGHKGSFANVANRLAPEYHLFALDLRGRGDSDKPADGYGFAYHARDILAFAEAFNIESFALIGHSFGATIGVYLASIRPKRVQAIVLIDGGADPNEETLQAMYSTIRRLGKVYPSLDDYLAAMRALPYHSPWDAALEHYFREDVDVLPDGSVRSRSSAEAIERDLNTHVYYSMCLHFPNLRCPVLFLRPRQGLFGDRGHVFTGREADAIVAHIPNCRRVDWPGVNHYTMVLCDDPPVVAPIHAFLGEVLAKPVRQSMLDVGQVDD